MSLPCEPPVEPVDKPVGHCEKCRGEVWQGEAMIRWEGLWLCPDCFKNAVLDMAEEYPEALALSMNLEVMG